MPRSKLYYALIPIGIGALLLLTRKAEGKPPEKEVRIAEFTIHT